MKNTKIWFVVSLVLLMLLIAGCGGQATEAVQESGSSTESQTEDESSNKAEEAANPGNTEGSECPEVTIADRKGITASDYERIYELTDYEAAAGCKMTFSENPDIASLKQSDHE